MSTWHMRPAGVNVSRLDQIRPGNIPKMTERVGKESNADSYIAHFYSFMGALTVDIINRVKRLMSLPTSQQQAKKRRKEREREREREWLLPTSPSSMDKQLLKDAQ